MRPATWIGLIALALLTARGICAAEAPTPYGLTLPAAPEPLAAARRIDPHEDRPRVAVISDIGNEPDDQMSLIRLLVYSNELDIEALVAATSVWQPSTVRPDIMHSLVQTYGQVRPNLLLHAQGWPETGQLESRIAPGQPGLGLAATGLGHGSPGAELLVHAIEREDPRPLWILVWGGANSLAQALIELRAQHDPQSLDVLIARLRVYSISDQDDAGAWIRKTFPSLAYIVSPSSQDGQEYAAATWTGISGDLYYRNGDGADPTQVSNAWLDQNIRAKGVLGARYPKFLFIMEGDTPSFLGLINNGLEAYRNPAWGGWGGRYLYRTPHGETRPIWTQGGDAFWRLTSADTVIGADGRGHVSDQATIWRWRSAFQNDFSARLDWTIKSADRANHNPVAWVNGVEGTHPLEIWLKTGESAKLDASGSHDPDKDQLRFRWTLYPEAGASAAHVAQLHLSAEEGPVVQVTAQSACRETWLGAPPCASPGEAHLILSVTDDGAPPLTSYRRIIVHVSP